MLVGVDNMSVQDGAGAAFCFCMWLVVCHGSLSSNMFAGRSHWKWKKVDCMVLTKECGTDKWADTKGLKNFWFSAGLIVGILHPAKADLLLEMKICSPGCEMDRRSVAKLLAGLVKVRAWKLQKDNSDSRDASCSGNVCRFHWLEWRSESRNSRWNARLQRMDFCWTDHLGTSAALTVQAAPGLLSAQLNIPALLYQHSCCVKREVEQLAWAQEENALMWCHESLVDKVNDLTC